jgi:hypothetical protein
MSIRVSAAVIFSIATFVAMQAHSETIVEAEAVAATAARDGSLGTGRYAPREREKRYLSALPESEQTNGSAFEDYSIHGKKGKQVSWFGIVRTISNTGAKKGEFELLLDHKYFDGLTDTHIMALSFNGSGDFKARVHGMPSTIAPLVLARVYGKVVGEKDGVPILDAVYVRIWPWRTFTFLDAYGTDLGNPRWRKPGVAPKRIYSSSPDDAYYRKLLGDRP